MVLKKYEMSRGETGAVNNTMVSGFRSQVESGLFNEFREYEYICKLMGKQDDRFINAELEIHLDHQV